MEKSTSSPLSSQESLAPNEYNTDKKIWSDRVDVPLPLTSLALSLSLAPSLESNSPVRRRCKLRASGPPGVVSGAEEAWPLWLCGAMFKTRKLAEQEFWTQCCTMAVIVSQTSGASIEHMMPMPVAVNTYNNHEIHS